MSRKIGAAKQKNRAPRPGALRMHYKQKKVGGGTTEKGKWSVKRRTGSGNENRSAGNRWRMTRATGGREILYKRCLPN